MFVGNDEHLASFRAHFSESGVMKVRLTQTSLLSIPAQNASLAEQMHDVLERGQAMERRAQRSEARELYESALKTGVATTHGEVGQLLRLISRTHLLDGDYAAADDSAHAALAVAEQSSDEAGRGRAINMLASI